MFSVRFLFVNCIFRFFSSKELVGVLLRFLSERDSSLNVTVKFALLSMEKFSKWRVSYDNPYDLLKRRADSDPSPLFWFRTAQLASRPLSPPPRLRPPPFRPPSEPSFIPLQDSELSSYSYCSRSTCSSSRGCSPSS